jgi:CHAT domain-containing protein
VKGYLRSGLVIFMLLSQVVNAQVTRQLTRDELNTELRTELLQNNDARCIEIIKNHRLLIKPFIDGLNTESIRKKLKGKIDESEQLNKMAAKTAEVFNKIFNEKSLLIAVNYLTIWSKGQMEIKLTADSLYAAGTKFRLGNEPEKAIDLFEKALTLYSNIGDERGEAEVLGGFGAVYYNNTGDYQTAFNYYEKALAKREKVDDQVLMGNTLSSIGSLYHDYFSDFPKAITYLSRAERIRDESGDLVNLGRTIHVKASALEKNGQPDSALKYFARSYELNGLAGDKFRMAQAMLHSGEILNTIGKYPEALDCLQKSLDLYKDLKMRTEEGEVLSQIGFVYSNIGELDTAIRKITEAAGIMKETNAMEGIAGVYNHLGIVLREAGRYEKSLEYYFMSLEIYEKIGKQSQTLPVLGNIGNVYKDLKDYIKAEDFHTRGLKICRESNAKIEEVHYLLNLSNDQLLQGKLDEAKTNYDLANEVAKPFNNPDLNWRIVVGLAEYFERNGDYAKAVALNDSALKILEIMRGTLQTREQKTSYMASERYVYEDIISLLSTLHNKYKSKNYDKLAFIYAERSKSRVLLDMLSEAKADSLVSQPVSLDEAKSLCPDRNTIILDYFVGDSSSCLWVITHSKHSMIKLPGLKTLREQIETLRFSLLDPQQAVSEFFINAGTLLFEELIKPAEPFLSSKSLLIIIPDGILSYLPFEVLLTENKNTTAEISYSDLPFLVKKYPVSYGQSASVLKTLIAKSPEAKELAGVNKRLIAFGDPLYDDTLFNVQVKYPRLEFSGKEIENISSYFKGGYSDIYLRNKATEENLKHNNELNKFNYVHFATHGSIDEDKPDLSSLVLTSQKNSGEDGSLQTTEIFKLKLNADLVVLSACQTGLGKLVRGEGMIGLTRAFMYAGTPSVIVSLWSVSDMSTADLMGEFYKNLIKNKLSKTDALRKARLALIVGGKYSHPFYWAPFVLIGDWR